MEKDIIKIRRIQGDKIIEKEDEVAKEYHLEIQLRSRDMIHVTCTPTFLEEMILARRYLADDFTREEQERYGIAGIECTYEKNSKDCPEQEKKSGELIQVSLEEIFTIARDSFENPGPLFVTTGCAHSCALIHEGKVVCCIEDIGRHNALDKVIGYALKNKISIQDSYIFSSGRISEDYLQKAIAAGFRMVVSRAAVTDAAAALAGQKNITLLGFIRKNTGNIYHEGAVSLK